MLWWRIYLFRDFATNEVIFIFHNFHIITIYFWANMDGSFFTHDWDCHRVCFSMKRVVQNTDALRFNSFCIHSGHLFLILSHFMQDTGCFCLDEQTLQGGKHTSIPSLVRQQSRDRDHPWVRGCHGPGHRKDWGLCKNTQVKIKNIKTPGAGTSNFHLKPFKLLNVISRIYF